MKAHRVTEVMIAFRCPGCNGTHAVDIKPEGRWTFDGNYDRPTLSPSVNISHAAMKDGEERTDIPEYRCHSIITAGRIQFLGDCTHALKGQVVDLPEWES